MKVSDDDLILLDAIKLFISIKEEGFVLKRNTEGAKPSEMNNE